jgi:hypothetical protein
MKPTRWQIALVVLLTLLNFVMIAGFAMDLSALRHEQRTLQKISTGQPALRGDFEPRMEALEHRAGTELGRIKLGLCEVFLLGALWFSMFGFRRKTPPVSQPLTKDDSPVTSP